jgi:HK97 family phage prohead protease
MTTRSSPLEFKALTLEVKALTERHFEGHAAVFGNVDQGGDVVLPGAFARSLTEHQRAGTTPSMFWMHDAGAVPGVWKTLEEDAKGLHVVGELVDTALGNELRTLLQTKAVTGLSIGYRSVVVDFDREGHRLLKDVELWEVSLVSLPMNPRARVAAVKGS